MFKWHYTKDELPKANTGKFLLIDTGPKIMGPVLNYKIAVYCNLNGHCFFKSPGSCDSYKVYKNVKAWAEIPYPYWDNSFEENTKCGKRKEQEIYLLEKYYKYCEGKDECCDCEIEDECDRLQTALTSLDDYFSMWGED